MKAQKLSEPGIKKLFSPWMLLLCGAGLALNIGLSKLVILLDLPLYIDNMGSILTAALGGALPGMAVGFLSNMLGSLSTPISMYYGILTIIMAALSSVFSRRGLLKKWYGWLAASACFILIGGGIGSVMTWFLYGGGIGGLAGTYAQFFCKHGFTEFCAQLTADVLVDVPDKLLTVGAVCLFLRYGPEKLFAKFPYGYIYDRSARDETKPGERPPIRNSVNMRVINILMAAVTFISATAVTIGSVYHHQRLITSYETIAEIYSAQAAKCVDGDEVADILSRGEEAPHYDEVKGELTEIYENSDHISYIYVYAVRTDGCHVVFDVDTPDLPGEKPGSIVENEQYFYDNLELFLAGDEVPPEYTNGEYGALITGYSTVKDTSGNTVAYAGVDISIENYILDMLTYVIQVISVLFAVALVISGFTLWYANRHIVTPIQAIVSQSQALDAISPEKWLDSEAWKNREPIKTGDELEELYNTVCKVEENASRNVKKLMETEQRLLQTKELERINRELAITIKKADDANHAKTDFLSRMSHDIRTPLNAIIGTASLARDELDDPASMEESLDTIASSGQFLLGLINDILDINKIEQGDLELRPEPFPVTDFINSVENTIRPLAEKKNIDFVFEMNCGHGMIFVDKLRYKQIFFNLLSNAIKYTPEGGKVEFTAEALDAPESIAGVRNHVRDNGVGMSKEYMEHLYEPFTRDSSAVINQTEGSGLGLAIVKNIVDAMGGSIKVESALGKGTEFTVDLYLPIAKQENGPEAAEKLQGEENLQGRRILLVEDNAVNTRIAKKLLERKGCAVSVAVNGKNAVETFAASPEGGFELVLMDIRMPVMDGLEATRAIRALDRADAGTVPIIAMTANAYEEDVRQSLSAGMNAHLSKPIEPEKLYEALLKYIRV